MDLPRRHERSRPRKGVHAHGRKFRGHRQRRISRHTLGTGNPSYASLLPNVLLRNNEGNRSSTSPHPLAPASCTRDTVSRLLIWTMTATKRSLLKSAARRRRQSSTAIVRESWSRKRLDQLEARGRQEQPGGDRRSNQADRRKRWARNSLDPPLRRERRVLRRFTS